MRTTLPQRNQYDAQKACKWYCSNQSVIDHCTNVSFLLDSRLSAFIASEHWMAAHLSSGSPIRNNGTELILASTAMPGVRGAILILAQGTRAQRGVRDTGKSTTQDNITTYVFKTI